MEDSNLLLVEVRISAQRRIVVSRLLLRIYALCVEDPAYYGAVGLAMVMVLDPSFVGLRTLAYQRSYDPNILENSGLYSMWWWCACGLGEEDPSL